MSALVLPVHDDDPVPPRGSLPVTTLRLGLAAPPAAPGPDLASYDCIVVAVSGGKDSLAALLATLREVARLPAASRPPVHLVHADLGAVEWPGIRELVQRQADQLGVPLGFVARQGTVKTTNRGTLYRQGEVYGDLVEDMRRNKHMFRRNTRLCTSGSKREPIRKQITALANQYRKPGHRVARILNVVGLRAAESPGRKKLKPFAYNKKFSSGRKHVDTWLCIHQWTEAQVWRCIWESGLEWAWPYDAGLERLSCVFCIFGNMAAFRIGALLRRRLAIRYGELEVELDQTLGQGGASVMDALCDSDADIVTFARNFGEERIPTWQA